MYTAISFKRLSNNDKKNAIYWLQLYANCTFLQVKLFRKTPFFLTKMEFLNLYSGQEFGDPRKTREP